MPALPLSQTVQSRFAADLVELACERSPEKRTELLCRITDAYIEQPDQRTPAERHLFEEIMMELIDKISGHHKAAASARLAEMPELPVALAHRLASDGDIEVARPIIRDYRGLSEQTLVDVAKQGSQAHLHVIAGRPVVTPPVTDVVVARGDRRTVRTLAANAGARFSSKGMDVLIRKAEADGDLQALIVERADLSLGAIGKLLPLISNELANRLRSTAIEIDESLVQLHLTEWAEERQKDIARTDAYIEGLRQGDLNLNDVVLDLVKAKRLFDTATVLAAMIDLDRYYTFNLLTCGNIQTVPLLLKSVELSWPAVNSFLNLRVTKAGVDDFDVPDRRDYDAIDVATAQRVVQFMKLRRAAAAAG